MVGVLLFLVLAGLVLLVVYGLHRPHFWMFAALVVFVGLPVVIAMALFSRV